MAGLASIRAFGATDAQLALFTRITNKNLSAYFSYFAVSRWLSMRLDCVTATVVLGIGVFAGLFRDSMSAGLLGVALAQGLQMSGLLQFAVRQGAETESYMTSVERIAEYGDLDVETDRVKGVDCQDRVQVDNVVNAVEFRDVVMRYSRDLPAALNGVSFSCKPREKIGIVGRTGGGKSSLGVALFRIVNPERGSVLLDGVDTGCMSLEELRTKVAVIPQVCMVYPQLCLDCDCDSSAWYGTYRFCCACGAFRVQSPVLFSGTLRANLDPFDTVSDERIWTALTRVHMAEAVRNMQDGLSSFVAENGENFSVGQRQLLCLARALIREAPVIYMDEATANVDGDTDALIQGTIRSEFAACTVLTVAHRLNTVVDCDRVLVMVSGVVVEFDSPAALLRDDNSHFTGLVNETGARSAAYLREAAFAAEASRNSGGVNGKMALE
jgi:ABC-type multidrug transport system fused ATPase/permease subunit